MRKLISTVAFIALSVTTIFSQAQPRATTETVMLAGKPVQVTRKSSTDIKPMTADLIAVYDCDGDCSPKNKVAKLMKIVDGRDWRYREVSFRCINRGNMDILPSGIWFIASLPLEKDEIAIIEITANKTNAKTQYELISWKHRDVMRKLFIPELGTIKITVMKIKDFIKISDPD